MKSSVFSKICSVLLSILTVFFACVLVLRIFLFGIEIRGSSMDHTLYNSQIVVVHRTKEVAKGDIVIIEPPERMDNYFTGDLIVKRIVATQGDSFYVENNVFYLKEAGASDYVVVEEPYVSSATPDISPVTLQDGEIYCLGDNRNVSKDSSEVGPFSVSDVKGVVLPSLLEESVLKTILLILL